MNSTVTSKSATGITLGLMLMFLFNACAAAATCSPARVDVGGYRVWMQVAGEGEPTVVFENGGGDDASVWMKVEPEVRQHSGVRTVLYDRAGLGQSDPKPGPYSIDNEVTALEQALRQCGVSGPIVLVAHSYGGFVSMLMAANDHRVAGIVFVDANLPGFFDDTEVKRIQAVYTPQFGALQRAKPELARVMIPLMQAYSETAKRVRSVSIPLTLPVIDIVAEKTWVDTPQEVAAMRQTHASFVAASPARQAVFAKGSSHQVMKDRTDLVIDAVERMVVRVRDRK